MFQKSEVSEFSSLIQKLGMDENEILQSYIITELEKNWEDIVGGIFVNHSAPIKFSDGVLTIVVSHPAYKMELSLSYSHIFQNINRKLGSRVQKIKIIVGNIKFTKAKKFSKPETLEGKENLLPILELETDKESREKLLSLIKKI